MGDIAHVVESLGRNQAWPTRLRLTLFVFEEHRQRTVTFCLSSTCELAGSISVGVRSIHLGIAVFAVASVRL